jgi:hypothetical protein
MARWKQRKLSSISATEQTLQLMVAKSMTGVSYLMLAVLNVKSRSFCSFI